jgi:hypothetical protein
MFTANAVSLPAFAGCGGRFEGETFDVGLFFAVSELGRDGFFGGGDRSRDDRFGFGVHGDFFLRLRLSGVDGLSFASAIVAKGISGFSNVIRLFVCAFAIAGNSSGDLTAELG